MLTQEQCRNLNRPVLFWLLLWASEMCCIDNQLTGKPISLTDDNNPASRVTTNHTLLSLCICESM